MFPPENSMCKGPGAGRRFQGRLACVVSEQTEQDAAGGRHRQGQTSQGLVGQAGSLDFLLRAAGSRGMKGARRESRANGVQRGGRNSEMRGRDTLEVSIKHLRWLWKLALVGAEQLITHISRSTGSRV